MTTIVKHKRPSEIMEDGILPCGHAAEREEDKIIIDQCFQCDWATEARKIANQVNDAAASRAEAETDLIKWCRERGDVLDKDGMTELFHRSVRIKLRHDREEALRETFKEVQDEEREVNTS